MSKQPKPQKWPFIRFAKRENRWVVDSRTKDGGSRRFFANKDDAVVFADQCKNQRKNTGTSEFGNAELQSYGKTIRDAVEFYLVYLRQQKTSVPVKEAVAEFFKVMPKRKEWSDRYEADIRTRIARFASSFGDREIATIDAKAIADWLDSLPGTNGTRNTLRRRIAVLFAFALTKEWLTTNPFAGGRMAKVAIAKEKQKKVQILSVDQAAKLLKVASEETRPFWAIALFAGLRPESELDRLQWEHIDFEEKALVVDGGDSGTEKTKTGRRVVKMHDNLIGWLRPLAKKSGKVAPSVGLWKKLRADKRKLGFGTPGKETNEERAAGIKLRRWVEDITRHSYVSYLLAECDDIGVTSTQAGNTPAMVRKHYLSLVKKKEAARYWQITPSPAAEK